MTFYRDEISALGSQSDRDTEPMIETALRVVRERYAAGEIGPYVSADDDRVWLRAELERVVNLLTANDSAIAPESAAAAVAASGVFEKALRIVRQAMAEFEIPSPRRGRACNSALGLTKRIYIGFSSDGAEIVATYTSRREVDEFRQPDEIVSGPWMRVPRAARAPVKGRGKRRKRRGR